MLTRLTAFFVSVDASNYPMTLKLCYHSDVDIMLITYIDYTSELDKWLLTDRQHLLSADARNGTVMLTTAMMP